jgi:ankyrin repeat protein
MLCVTWVFAVILGLIGLFSRLFAVQVSRLVPAKLPYAPPVSPRTFPPRKVLARMAEEPSAPNETLLWGGVKGEETKAEALLRAASLPETAGLILFQARMQRKQESIVCFSRGALPNLMRVGVAAGTYAEDRTKMENRLTKLLTVLTGLIGLYGCAYGSPQESLVDAIRRHDSAQVRRLLAAGVPVNESTEGFTPLSVAADSGNREAVSWLLERGAKVNVADYEGRTPLMRACVRGDSWIIATLVEHGANVDEKSKHGMTPLIYCAWSGSAASVELLLAHGAKVNEATQDGFTALMNAAYTNNEPVARILLSHGADIRAQDREGRTALSRSVMVAPHPMGPLSGDPHSGGLIAQQHRAFINFLLSHGAQVNTTGRWATPLMIAAMNCDYVAAELLLAHGADPRPKNSQGRTAMSYAQEWHMDRLIKLLKQHGG